MEKNEAQEYHADAEKILKEVMDAEGYVIFAAVLDNDVDKDGNRTVSYKYRRFQFNFEDTKKAVQHMIRQYQADVQKGLSLGTTITIPPQKIGRPNNANPDEGGSGRPGS